MEQKKYYDITYDIVKNLSQLIDRSVKKFGNLPAVKVNLDGINNEISYYHLQSDINKTINSLKNLVSDKENIAIMGNLSYGATRC